MPVDTLTEPTTRSRSKTGEITRESDSDIRGGNCIQTHLRKQNGDICEGSCTLNFSHYPQPHHCGKCGESY